MYRIKAGMTGTAMTEATEFDKIYQLEVVEIPTNRPVNRVDHNDKMYRSTDQKYMAIVEEIHEVRRRGRPGDPFLIADVLTALRPILEKVGQDTSRVDEAIAQFNEAEVGDNKVVRFMLEVYDETMGDMARGRPILVGTTSVENSEKISKLLDREYGIDHEVLNAKNHAREAEIVAKAGFTTIPTHGRDKTPLGNVTVATNMAGRGVDIILGGNPPDQSEAEKVKQAGGLFVLGTERHEARRIDNQLRGRAGRQGDPGASQFFVSLEDDLMRVFGGDRIKGLMETLKIPEDQPIKSGLISNSIEGAQGKIEGYHFDARKHVLDYDEVLNKQRNIIYGKRRELPPIKELIEEELRKMVDFHMAASHPGDWNIEEIFENVKGIAAVPDDFHKELSAIRSKSADPDVL
ncbi:MAG: hypothetical protein IH897_11845, partial [Planctomycetes bacterium]|nr:hypothetical protein [Planctomycetota bacterium]